MTVAATRLLADVTDDEIIRTCVEGGIAGGGGVEDAAVVCEAVLRWTGNETLAEAADWAATVPLRIVLILFGAFVINRLVRRLIVRFIQRVTDEDAAQARQRLRRLTPNALLESSSTATPLRSASRAYTIGLVLKSSASIVIYTLAVMMALGELGVDLAPLIAGAGIVGVALGFGAQSLVKDFLSGLFMLAEDQYGVGDVVDLGEAVGTVEVVNLRTTKLRAVDGTVWHVPNGEIRRVGNMSQQWARAVLDVEVAYNTDLRRATEVVKEVAVALWQEEEWQVDILEEPEVWGVEALGASGIAIRLVVKTQPGQQWKVTRELNRRIKERFDVEGIEIPFPQQVMWIRRDEGSSRDLEGESAGAAGEPAGDG